MGAFVNRNEEQATLQLEQLKVRVDKIHIEGIQRTKNDFIKDSFNDIFKVSTFQELIEKTVETRLKLEKIGCFKNISILIDTSSGPKSTPGYGYDVTFNVVELGRIRTVLNTSVGNNEGSIKLAVQSPNVAGRGENVQAALEYSTKKLHTFNTTLVKPLKFYDGAFSTSLFKQNGENTAAGYKLSEYGSQLGFSFLYGGKLNHNIEYEGIVRNLSVLHRNVAFPVREHSGYTLKSAIKNTFSVDSRDSKVFPTTGSILQLKTEFAGLGGNIGFLKNEIFTQINIPLVSDFSIQGSFGAGIMTETTKDKFHSIEDRFFIGGPLSLRGFHIQSVGPTVDGFAFGGSLYWQSAVHLYTPLPHQPVKGSFGDSFRLHIFGNAGNLTKVSGNMKDCFESLRQNMRLTYGIGLVYRLGQKARIELNYCIPYLYQKGDKLIDGVQCGLGVDFL